MAQTLTWSVLSPEFVNSCLEAANVVEIREVLRRCDAASSGTFLHSKEYEEGQVNILLDLYAHLVMFAKARLMSAEKVSTLTAIMKVLHDRSMSERRTRVASYDLLRELIVRHSVPRPPYSAGIFSLEDVHDIDEHLMSTYYRHYKMYMYAFVPKQLTTVTMTALGALNDVPQDNIPALAKAIPMAEWMKKVEEEERKKEEEMMETNEKYSEEVEVHRMRASALNDPRYSDGIKEQLEVIRNSVMTKSVDRLDWIEERLTALESRVEDSSRSRPGSRASKKK